MEEILFPTLQFEEHGVGTVLLEEPSWSTLGMRRPRHTMLEEEVANHPTLGLKELREPMLSLWRLGNPMLGLEEVEIAMIRLIRLIRSTLDEEGTEDDMKSPWDLRYPKLGMGLIKPLT